ncbi:amidohydrolase family protein [Pseudonocardia ailaonensis]|uniref:Amidohydrolase family protein n=1 Tax=Pseudonocardia ailaonensis TaxID=367279 RepID=A0ABN2N3Z7_9PSEU
MPLQPEMKLISVDDHLVEHPMVWQDRLPEAYKEAGPKIVETETGQQLWQYEDRRSSNIGLNAVAGKDPSEYGIDPLRYDEMIPGCYQPGERLKDMDIDGVYSGLCFPTFPRFAGTTFNEGKDRKLSLLCVQAYNDFMLDEWSATAPDRLPALCILPFWDVEAAAAEVRRVAGKGAKAITFPENPVPLGLPSFHTDHWEPVWNAIEETDLPVCLHFGTSRDIPITAPDAPEAAWISLMGTNSMKAMSDLCFSPVFHRHPGLKVSLSEGGVGWIPYLLERMDATWERHRFYQKVNQEVRPSELFRRNIWGCFISDDIGIILRHEIGLDRLTWECDYPHSDSNWPNSRKLLEASFLDVPDHEVRTIVETNAAKLFKLAV